MIDLEVIKDEIAALEEEDTTYETCEKLAWLYVVRDALLKKRVAELPDTRSDFLRAAAEAPTDSLLMVLDEHMDAIKVIYPQEYEKLVERIRKLSQD